MHAYQPAFKGKLINEETCRQVTGFLPVQFAELTGIYGYYDKETPFLYLGIEGEYPVVYIDVISSAVTLRRRVNLRTLIIENVFLEVRPSGVGIGVMILGHQLIAAKLAGFVRILCLASRAAHLNGYITFAKFGFGLFKERDIQAFADLQSRMGVSLPFHRFVEEHGAVWKKQGFPWDGEFELSSDAENWSIFRTYVLNKTRRVYDEKLRYAPVVRISGGLSPHERRMIKIHWYVLEKREKDLKLLFKLLSKLRLHPQ